MHEQRQRLRVVVVDDQDDIRMLVAFQLAAHDAIEVAGEFASAEEAAAAIASLEADVVVLDHYLGAGQTGGSSAQAILDAAPGIHIVFHVGDPMQLSASVPADEVVTKGGDIVAAVLRAASQPR